MSIIKIIMSIIVIAALFIACSDNSTEPETKTDPTEGLVKIGAANAAGTKVDVFCDRSPQVGYIKIYIMLSDSAANNLIENADVSIKPMMDMGHMKHSAPFENPGSETVDGLFVGAVNFIMAGTWQLFVSFELGDSATNGEIEITFDVAANNLIKSVVGADSMKYFVTLLQPLEPKVGMNDFIITVHYRESMMSFPAITDALVEIEPSMPSMGHGSPNNVNPMHETRGHYIGKVNFTMTGDWLIDVSVSRNNAPLLKTAFDINVP